MAATKPAEQISNNNLIIIMMLITFLVVGISALVAKALFSNIALDNRVVTKMSAADKQLGDDLTAAPKLVNAYNDLHDKANKLADALPNTQDFPALIVEMENIGGASGLVIKGVSNTPGTSDASATPTSSGSDFSPAPQTFPFSITFSGSFDSVVRELDKLETSARPMRVTGLQLNGTAKDLTGEIDVDTYYQDKAKLPLSKETVK